MTPQEQKAERERMYKALYNNVIPERFPVHDSVTWSFLMSYSGKDPVMVQYTYDTDECIEILEKGREVLRGDNFVAAGSKYAISLMLNRCAQSQMASSGVFQHPEREYMFADEYDKFIANPYDFYLEVVSPRQNLEYGVNEVNRMMAFTKVLYANMDCRARVGKANALIKEKYGYYSPTGGGGQFVPFDMIADHFRGFSKMPLDMRRQPEKLLEAIEAAMPFCIWAGDNPKGDCGANFIATHMAAYLSNQQFEKFYWPTFKKVVHVAAEHGLDTSIFIEQNWDRYVDYLVEMPMGTRFFMEEGDAQLYKDKMGKKHVLAGFYPLELFRSGTKQQCIDEAKRLVDILAPGGNYYFCPGKNALVASEINPENYVATMEWLLQNNKYDNAGQLVNPTMKKEDTIEHFEYPAFKTKYVVDFDEYIKGYPVVDPKVLPRMREEYEKYNKKMGYKNILGF